MSGASKEDLIRAAAGADWGWFQDIERKAAARGPNQGTIEARQRLAQATARLFASADGEILLEAMLDQTLRRIVFHTQLGIAPDQAVLNGAFREGQNALMVEILRLIAEGGGAPAPPPRA